MRMPALARPVLLALALSAIAPPGRATAERESCAELVGNRVYRCTVKTSFGTAFEDCWRVSTPGERSLRFDLAADGLREPFGCACEPRGDLRRPRFDASRRFTCTGGGTTGSLVVTLEGRVAPDGRRIRSGIGGNDAGDSLVFKCVHDPACAAGGVQP